jgi:tetratricopeptide (TPR) repeat protein
MQIGQANNATQETNQSAGSVLQWISQKTDWLMVYDGADGHYQTVEKYLPPGNGGNILITSRNVGLRRITLDSLQVHDMGDEEAVSLLLKSAGFDGLSEHDSNLAKKLASELGGIPIALDHAGAYMLTTQCGIADYLELYTNHKHELMLYSDFKGASDYDRTTYGTWDISMKNIENMAAKGVGEASFAAQSAIKTLRIVAFLNHVNISEELFKNAAENYMKRNVDDEADAHLPSPLSIRYLDHESLFLSKEGVWDKLKFLAGIQVLISLSFIEAHSQLYSVHLLVQSWIRYQVPKEEKPNLYHRTRALLSCSVNLDENHDNYAFCRILALHIRSNTLHGSELKLQSMYYEDEYDSFTLVFLCVGDWEEAEKLLLVQVNWRATVLGAENTKVAVSMGDLGYTYVVQGRWDQAEKLFVDIISAQKAKPGSLANDLFTLITMSRLAITYRNQGRWDEAEKLEVDVMNERKAKLGSDHPQTVESMRCLALIYWYQGRWDEAEKLFVDVMNARKAKLGSDHPETLDTISNLALTY